MIIEPILDLTVGPILEKLTFRARFLGSDENAKIVVLRSSIQRFADLRSLLGIVFQGESDYEVPGVVLTTF